MIYSPKIPHVHFQAQAGFLFSKSYCYIYSYCLKTDKVPLCNMDTNVCTYHLYYLTHKFPEQTVLMTLNPILTNWYRTLQHRASLTSTTVKDGFIPPQGRPLYHISHVCHSQYTDNNNRGFVHRLWRSLRLNQRAGMQQIYSVQYFPSINKDDFFVNCQELRNWWLILLMFLLAFNNPSPPSSAVHFLDNDVVYYNIQTWCFEQV